MMLNPFVDGRNGVAGVGGPSSVLHRSGEEIALASAPRQMQMVAICRGLLSLSDNNVTVVPRRS
jgi:hypothetical protein